MSNQSPTMMPLQSFPTFSQQQTPEQEVKERLAEAAPLMTATRAIGMREHMRMLDRHDTRLVTAERAMARAAGFEDVIDKVEQQERDEGEDGEMRGVIVTGDINIGAGVDPAGKLPWNQMQPAPQPLPQPQPAPSESATMQPATEPVVIDDPAPQRPQPAPATPPGASQPSFLQRIGIPAAVALGASGLTAGTILGVQAMLPDDHDHPPPVVQPADPDNFGLDLLPPDAPAAN